MIFLPLLGIVWIFLILNVSEPLALLPHALSLAVIIQAVYTLAGFCFVNARVRRNLYVSLLKCCGKEIPKDLDLSIDAIGSSSNIASDRPTSAVRKFMNNVHIEEMMMIHINLFFFLIFSVRL